MRKIFLIIVLAAFTTFAKAQSLKDLFSKDKIQGAVEGILGDVAQQEINPVGTWKYSKCAIDFESDNFLQKAGGELAAAQLEVKIQEALTKAGINKDSIFVTFTQDNNFSCTANKIKSTGTYSVNQKEQTMDINYLKGVLKTTCKAKMFGNKLEILYKADKLLEIIKTIAGSTNLEALEAASNLLNQYEGCYVGLELIKN